MIEIGSFVKSNQGRDKENIYIVKGFFEKKVLLVDGKSKTVQNPKVKNLKHLIDLNEISEKLQKKFMEQTNVFDAEVYSTIKKFLDK